ncbi:hypothetical protein [Tenacibaculum sp. SDUM215027]|uniref:hypothetical protein n=1 Tax=Tenacibaculum sp. SDUM215027 TaxID=3422596 RepID=UPI003D311578
MNQELKRPEKIRVFHENLDDNGSGKYTGLEYWYKGKPATIFPDNAMQPRKSVQELEINPF